MPEKLPPRSIEAEQSLLGGLMLDKNAIFRVMDLLSPKDFYQKSHQEIYLVCQELMTRSEPIDFLSVSTRLKEKGILEEMGGNSYLTELVNMVATPGHSLNYAKIVQRKRVLRDLISASQDIGTLGYEETEDINVLLDRAEKRIFTIAQKGLMQDFVPVRDTLEDAFERIDRLSKHEAGLRGLATGFSDLDNVLAGLQNSDLIILAARPSLGKSAFALNIASNIASESKIPVGVFSLEMSKDQLVERLLASQANVDSWRIRTGKLQDVAGDNDFSRLQVAMGSLSEAPLYINDIGMANILQIRAMARRLQQDKGLGLLVIDYLQLMDHTNKYASPIQQVTENSRALKMLAKELNIPILVLSQLSRAVEQRTPHRPMLSDLRESGAIEQDADVVMFIYREDKYNENSLEKNIAEIIVAKHRNGPTGAVKLYFDENRVSFRNLESGDYVSDIQAD